MKLGRLILPPIVLAAAVFGLIALNAGRHTGTAEAAPGAVLFPPEASCTGGATTTVDFKWVPYAGESQWLDVGTSPDFAPGTFTGHGPYDYGVSDKTLKDLPATQVLYWRVNTLTADGWITSNTDASVPCGAPKLLWGPLSCDGRFAARVNFRWAPSGLDITAQYIDVSFDPNFPAGGFISSPRQIPTAQSFNWYNLQVNTQTYFRVNSLDTNGVWHTSDTGAFYADCAPPVREGIIPSDDRLVINRIGVDAPVNVRDVGSDGLLGDPEGPLDVIRYTFPVNPGYGNYPGQPGTTFIAGHLDFRYYGLAVFGHLDQLQPGDVIDYYRGDGVLVSYVVDWVEDMDPSTNFGLLAQNGSVDAMILITCNGTFDWDVEEYSARRVVHATALPPAN
jgi:LPXTG-site transpeptidase (sortase) family protein